VALPEKDGARGVAGATAVLRVRVQLQAAQAAQRPWQALEENRRA
jgi:hypothetical protein